MDLMTSPSFTPRWWPLQPWGKREGLEKEFTLAFTLYARKPGAFLLSLRWCGQEQGPHPSLGPPAREEGAARGLRTGPQGRSRSPPLSSPAHAGVRASALDHAWPRSTSFCPGSRTPAAGGGCRHAVLLTLAFHMVRRRHHRDSLSFKQIPLKCSGKGVSMELLIPTAAKCVLIMS